MGELILSQAAATELSVYQRFDENSVQMQAWRANVGEDSELALRDLVTVKTPNGGSVFWQVEKPGADPQSVRAITGICVFQGFSGVLWPSTRSAKGSKPVLDAHGLYSLKTGRLRATVFRDPETKRINYIEGVDDPSMVQTLADLEIFDEKGEPTSRWDWQALPYSKFGSGRGDAGKRVKESRGLFILQKGDILPTYIRTAPSALLDLKNFFFHLTVPYWHAVVEVTLRKESKEVVNENGVTEQIDVAIPVLKHVETLSPEAAGYVKSTLTTGIERLWLAGSIESADTE